MPPLTIDPFIFRSDRITSTTVEKYNNQAAANANIENWEWRDKRGWGKADPEWQAFFDKWRTNSDRDLLNDRGFPSLSLAPLTEEQLVLQGFPRDVLIRGSYGQLLHRILLHALGQLHALGHNSGFLILGQRGTGKTLFLFYLLIRLLQLKQVVLFSIDGIQLLLFFHDTVYLAIQRDAYLQLPRHKSSQCHVFIWSLFDLKREEIPRHPLLSGLSFEVQSACFNQIRYKLWAKHINPVRAVLPLWTHEELICGLKCQDYYEDLFTALHKIYSAESIIKTDIDHATMLRDFPGASEILLKHYPMTSEAEEEKTRQTSPEGALYTLLDAATHHFGYAARDVFHGIKDFPATISYHEDALSELKLSGLKDAVLDLSGTEGFPDNSIYHRILTIHPIFCDSGDSYWADDWTVNFKSNWIGRSLVGRLGAVEDTDLQETILFFRNQPRAIALAGWFFEPYAHCQLSAPQTDGFWHLTNMEMKTKLADPPIFLMGTSSLPNNVQFPKITRELVKFKSPTDIPIQLEYSKYYVTPPNFPLFDAFTIDFDSSQNRAILWILQMTASRTHEDSPLGYRMIRKIIATLKKQKQLLNVQKVSDKQTTSDSSEPPVKIRRVGDMSELKVEVCYILVTPSAGGHLKQLKEWSFPKGWNENFKQNDHRGLVYTLEIDLSVESRRKLY